MACSCLACILHSGPVAEIDSQPPVSRQAIEALSWKLIAEFHRRHPERLKVIEAHPGGGQYDCLGLVRGGEVIAFLNRVGSFTCFPSGAAIEWQDLWPRCLTAGGLGQILDKMSRLCGLEVPSKLPPSSTPTVAFRAMALIAATLCLDLEPQEWDWRNGAEDTSGKGCQSGRDEWFKVLCLENELAQARGEGDADFGGRYRYWFLLRDGVPQCCVIADRGVACLRDGSRVELAEAYSRTHRAEVTAGMLLSRFT